MKQLAKYTTDQLATFWCQLNSWNIPDELKDKISEPKMAEINPWMTAIVKKIGKTTCLKKWNEIMDKR
jgi:hypothetical protein